MATCQGFCDRISGRNGLASVVYVARAIIPKRHASCAVAWPLEVEIENHE